MAPHIVTAPHIFTHQVSAILSKADEWAFDSFELAEATDNRPLSTMAFFLCKRAGLSKALCINEAKLARFLICIEDGYRNNPYHSRVHAADVLRNLHVIANRGGLLKAMGIGEPVETGVVGGAPGQSPQPPGASRRRGSRTVSSYPAGSRPSPDSRLPSAAQVRLLGVFGPLPVPVSLEPLPPISPNDATWMPHGCHMDATWMPHRCHMDAT